MLLTDRPGRGIVLRGDDGKLHLTPAGLAISEEMLVIAWKRERVAVRLRSVEAEVARGRRINQVEFTRRQDDGYRAMKTAITDNGWARTSDALRAPKRLRAGAFSGDMLITDSAIHEIDLVRWLLDEEIAAASFRKPHRTGRSRQLDDPQLIILETSGGVVVEVKVFVNCAYGYDIRCEVVCESGTVSLADSYLGVLETGHRAAVSLVDGPAFYADAC